MSYTHLLWIIRSCTDVIIVTLGSVDRLVLDKTEGITILTIPSSVKEKKEVSKQIVAPSDTYLARCEHALNGDADSHDAQGGGPVIAKNRSAYLESMSSARERSYAKRARRLHDRSCRRAIINGRHDEL